MYWAHVISPLLAVWLYILHRLAGPKIKWKTGVSWAVSFGVVVVALVALHTQDPRNWNVVGPKEGAKYFEPSLARTASVRFPRGSASSAMKVSAMYSEHSASRT